MRGPLIPDPNEPSGILIDAMFGKEIRFHKRVENLEDDVGRIEDHAESLENALRALVDYTTALEKRVKQVETADLEKRVKQLETVASDSEKRIEELEAENENLREELGERRIRDDQTVGEWLASVFDAIQTGYEQEQLTVSNIVKIKRRLDELEKQNA